MNSEVELLIDFIFGHFLILGVSVLEGISAMPWKWLARFLRFPICLGFEPETLWWQLCQHIAAITRKHVLSDNVEFVWLNLSNYYSVTTLA